jgi:hypothetical protein
MIHNHYWLTTFKNWKYSDDEIPWFEHSEALYNDIIAFLKGEAIVIEHTDR